MSEAARQLTVNSVEDESSQAHRLPREGNAEHFHEHSGLNIWGKAGDEDLFFGSTMYRVGGRKWGIADGAFNQTYLLVTPTRDRVMKSNPFVSHRVDPIRHFAFDEIVESDRVKWKIGNRRLVARPPVWEINGEHHGVDLDLTLTAVHDPVSHHGSWEGLIQRGTAGDEVLCHAEGTCTYRGKTYELREGFGVRDKSCFGAKFDVLSLLGAGGGYSWSWIFGDELTVFYFSQTGSGHSAGRVFLEDRLIDFNGQQTAATILDTWTDPLTHDSQATRMRITMKLDEGDLDVEVNTWSRVVFGLHLAEGYTTHTGKCGRAKGRFIFPDRRVIPIDENLAYIEHGFATPLAAA
jgi:hypothetical protein